MALENSLLSENPNFYSAHKYEEQEGTPTQNIFIKVLLQLILVLSILLAIYFAFKYGSNKEINFKKFNLWNIEKQSEPPTLKVAPTEKSIKEKELNFKKAKIDRIVKKVMEKMSNEKVSETSITPRIEPTKVTSQEQVENHYLVEEYLDAIKKELGK